jgi:mRNA capping enzyme
VGVVQRQESPILGLRNFNNWVKSVLISRFAQPVLAASQDRTRGRPGCGKVLDMGCGKGGDLTKWAKARVKDYFGVGVWICPVRLCSSLNDSSQISPPTPLMMPAFGGKPLDGLTPILPFWIAIPSPSRKHSPLPSWRNLSTSCLCNSACIMRLRACTRRGACSTM